MAPLPVPVITAAASAPLAMAVQDADIDKSELPTIPSLSTSISDAVNAFPSRRLSTAFSSSLSARSRKSFSMSSSLPSPHLSPQPHSVG